MRRRRRRQRLREPHRGRRVVAGDRGGDRAPIAALAAGAEAKSGEGVRAASLQGRRRRLRRRSRRRRVARARTAAVVPGGCQPQRRRERRGERRRGVSGRIVGRTGVIRGARPREHCRCGSLGGERAARRVGPRVRAFCKRRRRVGEPSSRRRARAPRERRDCQRRRDTLHLAFCALFRLAPMRSLRSLREVWHGHEEGGRRRLGRRRRVRRARRVGGGRRLEVVERRLGERAGERRAPGQEPGGQRRGLQHGPPGGQRGYRRVFRHLSRARERRGDHRDHLHESPPRGRGRRQITRAAVEIGGGERAPEGDSPRLRRDRLRGEARDRSATTVDEVDVVQRRDRGFGS